MQLAMELGRASIAEDDDPHPVVGAVVVVGNVVVGRSFRGETGLGDHAEYGALEKLSDLDLRGATVITTLEPCSRRKKGKTPCAKRLIDREIGTVFIGMYDPDPMIHREGWKMMRDAGIVLRDFDSELRDQVREDNAAFIDQFRIGVGLTGTARFDYTQNGGSFRLSPDHSRTKLFTTRWTPMSDKGVYAIDYEHHVALARYAALLEEIHHPDSLDFTNYAVPVLVGDVVVFRNELGFALVKLERVDTGSPPTDRQTEIEISYELRLI